MGRVGDRGDDESTTAEPGGAPRAAPLPGGSAASVAAGPHPCSPRRRRRAGQQDACADGSARNAVSSPLGKPMVEGGCVPWLRGCVPFVTLRRLAGKTARAYGQASEPSRSCSPVVRRRPHPPGARRAASATAGRDPAQGLSALNLAAEDLVVVAALDERLLAEAARRHRSRSRRPRAQPRGRSP